MMMMIIIIIIILSCSSLAKSFWFWALEKVVFFLGISQFVTPMASKDHPGKSGNHRIG